MWTVPMKPLPMTAVPMSLRRVMAGSGSPSRSRFASVQAARLPGRNQSIRLDPLAGVERGTPRSASHPTLTCQGQKSCTNLQQRSVGCGRGRRHDPGAQPGSSGGAAVDPARDAVAANGGHGPHGPIPDESLDALVAVLDELRLGRSRSRGDVVARTGLSRSIVAQRVGELLDRGLVVEGDPGPSTGGRPPRQLAFNGDAGHLLVADLGASSIDVALTTLDGRILGHIAEPADIAAGPGVALARVEERFDQLRRTGPDLPGRLWGIGIGVPGPVEFRTGRPISPPIMPGWDGYPVRDRFAARFDAPVWVDNDVNILALGEWRAGVAAGYDNVVVVKWGPGIGAGIIADGRLHRGAQGSAGDVGHIGVSDDRSVVCRCGNSGCLEAFAGGAAIARDGEQAAREGRSARLAAILDARGGVTAEDVAYAASLGDPVAADLLKSASESARCSRGS